jgi:hypothetical protein
MWVGKKIEGGWRTAAGVCTEADSPNFAKASLTKPKISLKTFAYTAFPPIFAPPISSFDSSP